MIRDSITILKGKPKVSVNRDKNKNTIFFVIPTEISKPPSGGTITRLTHIRNAAHRDNISTRREVVEFRWDRQNTQTLPYKEYWEYMGCEGRERQCGNGPHTSGEKESKTQGV